VKDDSGRVIDVMCPCCRRNMGGEDASTFNATMDDLANPATSQIIQSDRTQSQQKKRLDVWYNSLNAGMSDWQEHDRLTQEVAAIQATMEETQHSGIRILERELEEEQKLETDLKNDLGDLGSVENDAIRLRDDATRIHDKKLQIKSRKDRLNLMAPHNTGGRSLRDVETSLTSNSQRKDDLMSKIASLNKEMTKLNSTISFLSNNAASAEKSFKEKSERYAKSQEASLKKERLTEQYKELEQQITKVRMCMYLFVYYHIISCRCMHVCVFSCRVDAGSSTRFLVRVLSFIAMYAPRL
jgi:DNA repair exonuclease SbcCD ATPase subunit